MEEHAREAFKIRFIKLTLLLNAIVLLIAIGSFVLLRFRSPTGLVVGLVLLAAAVITYVYFSRFYQETKEWLEVNTATGKEKV
jgi:multisubunit Na+/H+ antiporter MnhC subunit